MYIICCYIPENNCFWRCISFAQILFESTLVSNCNSLFFLLSCVLGDQMSVIDFSLNRRSGQVVNNTISWKTGHDVKNK